MLGLLAAVERDATQTQRGLARELGIALGLTNAYLKRCVRKGLVKVKSAPLRRYAYYLTPRGMNEKGRLTAQYLADSLSFYRRARTACTALTDHLAAAGRRRIVLVGAGDLAEVVMLSAADSGLEVAAIIDPTGRNRRCAGHAVLAAPPKGLAAEAIVIAAADADGSLRDEAEALAARLALTPDAIVMPELARVVAPTRADAKETA
jgi:DNA-binding MarR family transcriptional regulator